MARRLLIAVCLALLMLSGCMSTARRLTHTDGVFFTKPYAATTADALVAIGVPISSTDEPEPDPAPVGPLLRTAAAVDTPLTLAADTLFLPGDAIATTRRGRDD